MGKGSTNEKNSESSNSDIDSEPDSETVYYVEVIKGARVNEDNDFEYKVKWYEYGTEDETWEPTENVKDCDRLLKSFWKEVGKEHKRNPGPAGSEYIPSPTWIRKEQARFLKEMDDFAEKKRKKAERKEAKRKAYLSNRAALQEKKARAEKKAEKKAEAENEQATNSSNDLLGLFTDPEDEPMTDTKKHQKFKKDNSKTATLKPEKIGAVGSKQAASSGSGLNVFPVRSTNKYSGLKISKVPQAGTATSTTIASPSTLTPVEPGPSRITDPIRPPKPAPISHVEYRHRDSSAGSNPLSSFLPSVPRISKARSPVEPPVASGEAVDNFLATFLPFNVFEAPRLGNQNIILPKEKPKNEFFVSERNWTWFGDLFLDISGQDMAERLCEIAIGNIRDVSDKGLKMKFVLEKMDSLRFSKTYNRSEINNILPGLKRVDQFAKISARNQHDRGGFLPFVKYLQLRKLVICCAFMSTYGHVAEMVVFPYSNRELSERLKVPEFYEGSDTLVIALLPWHIKPSEYNLKYLKEDEIKDFEFEHSISKIPKMFHPMTQKPDMQYILRILQIEHWFIEFLPMRIYCIWAHNIEKPVQGATQRYNGSDTKALVSLLQNLKAVDRGHNNLETRVVFVHVSSLRSISNMPLLAERRSAKPETRFVTYGTHDYTNPLTWGFREIYPTGGIVTFTATALLEDPDTIARAIERIDRHPLWACYIHPSVLSIFIRITCPDMDPIALFQTMPFLWGNILDLIIEGKVALMCSPDNELAPGEESWEVKQIANTFKTPLDLVREGYTTFIQLFSDKNELEIRRSVERIISSDLAKMQSEQAICENYRRFVVIKGTKETDIAWNKDNFEWRTTQEFSFMDDYFKSEDELAPT